MIRPYAKVCSSVVRSDILSLEKKLAVTLYYLKDQGSLIMTANTFGIAKCTASKSIHEICEIVSKFVAPKLIKFPVEKTEVEEISKHFLSALWVSSSYRMY